MGRFTAVRECINSTLRVIAYTICIIITLSTGYMLLRSFLNRVLVVDKDIVYDILMQVGMIACIFNVFKFYVLALLGKSIKIVDVSDSGDGLKNRTRDRSDEGSRPSDDESGDSPGVDGKRRGRTSKRNWKISVFRRKSRSSTSRNVPSGAGLPSAPFISLQASPSTGLSRAPLTGLFEAQVHLQRGPLSRPDEEGFGGPVGVLQDRSGLEGPSNGTEDEGTLTATEGGSSLGSPEGTLSATEGGPLSGAEGPLSSQEEDDPPSGPEGPLSSQEEDGRSGPEGPLSSQEEDGPPSGPEGSLSGREEKGRRTYSLRSKKPVDSGKKKAEGTIKKPVTPGNVSRSEPHTPSSTRSLRSQTLSSQKKKSDSKDQKKFKEDDQSSGTFKKPDTPANVSKPESPSGNRRRRLPKE